MAHTHSQRLRKLAELGATIVVASGEYEGQEVVFAPRFDTDREPWALRYAHSAAEVDAGFSGDQCSIKNSREE